MFVRWVGPGEEKGQSERVWKEKRDRALLKVCPTNFVLNVFWLLCCCFFVWGSPRRGAGLRASGFEQNKEGYRNVWEWEKGPGVGEFELSLRVWQTLKQFDN